MKSPDIHGLKPCMSMSLIWGGRVMEGTSTPPQISTGASKWHKASGSVSDECEDSEISDSSAAGRKTRSYTCLELTEACFMSGSLNTHTHTQRYRYVRLAAHDLDQIDSAAGSEILCNSSPSFQGKLSSRLPPQNSTLVDLPPSIHPSITQDGRSRSDLCCCPSAK